MPTPEQLTRQLAVVPYAQATMRKWHVPASVTLAQWEFESGWGLDEIAVQCLNCFGIKHLQANLNEPYMEWKTPEYVGGVKTFIMDDFVKYASIADSFDAHGRLIATAGRYQRAMAMTDDVHAFARMLQMCGYSTNQKYASSLCGQIDTLGLTRYDVHP